LGAEQPLLEVRDLRTYFYTRRGVVKAVDGASFTVNRGETLGIVGESGSGKSVTCLSIVRLLPAPAGRIAGGQVLFEGEDLLSKSESEMRRLRGRHISMILQDPMVSLNPAFTLGNQIGESLYIHLGIRGRGLRERVIELLRQVRISDPEVRANNYPHQISGGMRQRVAGAIAISCSPSLLIADEPTTALDVTIQAQYLRLLKDIQRQTNVGLIFVTHDLGIVARLCDRVAVMYAGRIVESGTVREIFNTPRHPYTIGLLNCLPRAGAGRSALQTIPGQPPDLSHLPPGCPFAPRCTLADARCAQQVPPLMPVKEDGHVAACWRVDEAYQLLGPTPVPRAVTPSLEVMPP
jgi:oligopeptide/dipeptide ABC transporter ATP-binding protein